MAADSLAGWVEELRTRYGTMRKIADLIGMSESGFTRGVKRGTLSVENLLDLARATETHPSAALRMADKAAVAELIEELYGPGLDALTRSERELIDTVRSMNSRQKNSLLAFFRNFREPLHDSIQPVGVSGQRTTARPGSGSVPKRSGPTLADALVRADEDTASVSGPVSDPSHPVTRRVLADMDSLTRSLEHTEGVARKRGAARKRAATARAKTAASRDRARTHRG